MVFIYKGVSSGETMLKGEIHADTKEKAYEELESLGVSVYSLKKKLINVDWFNSSFSPREAIEFLKEILSVLKSGLSPLEAMHYVAYSEHSSPKFKQVGNEAYVAMKNGGTMSDGLRHGGFPIKYSDVIAVGEITGNLLEGIEIEIKQIELQVKISKGLSSIYVAPAVSGIFMLIATIAVIIYLAPMQEKIIYSLVTSKDQVPPISASAFWIAQYGIQIIIGFFVLLVLFFILKSALRKMFQSVDLFFDTLALSIPVFGSFYRNAEYAKISFSLTLAMGSGGRQSTVLEVIKNQTKSIFFRNKLKEAYRLVDNEGLLISDAFDEVGMNKLLSLTVKRGEMLDRETAMSLLQDLGKDFSNKSLYNMSVLKGASEMINMVMLSILSIPVLMITVAPSVDQVTLMMDKL